MSKKVLLISSGQPSLNPRLVKEADVLTEAGYDVTVLYAYWNEWGTRHDAKLLAGKSWDAICAGGGPNEKPLTWFLSRIIHKTARFLLLKTNFYSHFSELAIARSSHFLTIAAKKQRADLYIGHNLGALAATVKAAKLHKKPCGFDAEDFHRQEVTDDENSYQFKISKYIEDKYLPQVNYITASSLPIAQRYADLYNHNVTTILNVFPKTTVQVADNKDLPLRLFWFSQTIGPNRGLEMVIESLNLCPSDIELNLLGNVSASYRGYIIKLAGSAGVASDKVKFYCPIPADELFNFAAQFDIGLASETGFCLNNSIALSNKLLTYIQCGLAVAVSDTLAQSEFMTRYPQTGNIYRNAKELADIINMYNDNWELLYKTKEASFAIGQKQLNWEYESQEFMKIIEKTLAEAAKQ